MLKASLKNIMSEVVVTIPENATLAQAAHILLRDRINGILVVKKDNRKKVVGVLTTTDLLKLLDGSFSRRGVKIKTLNQISRLPVSAVSSRRVLRIPKSMKIRDVINIMHTKNKHTLPVYDGKKLVGVIGRHDILNAAFA